jgi:hypothetical protein
MTHLDRLSYAIKFGIWVMVSAAIAGLALALSAYRLEVPVIAATSSGQPNGANAPVLGSLPQGYRDWTLISVATLGSPFNDLRAKLGNDVAIGAYKTGKVPFPDGAIIARLAWKKAASEETNNALALEAKEQGLSADAIEKFLSETFVAGSPTNVQFMVKDSTRYASTGGWGFAQFTNGKPDNVTVQNCFACHASGKASDFVFTRYSP